MYRTRVGYTGGTKRNPTYNAMGDHTESFQVDFDPKVISYEQLLDIFWRAHNPCARAWSAQYKSAVFVHTTEQRRLAEKTRAAAAQAKGAPVTTEILTLDAFYLAEDYHQKYHLRSSTGLMGEFAAYYPDDREFVNSTAAARVNGYLYGAGRPEHFEKDLPLLGLSESQQRKLEQKIYNSIP